MAYGSPAARGAGDGRRTEMKGVFSDRARPEDSDGSSSTLSQKAARGVARSLLFGRLVSPNSGSFFHFRLFGGRFLRGARWKRRNRA
jgi:hypothetical protein